MLGTVDIRRSQVTDQHSLATKDIQRQETIMIVVTMKETTFLHTVHGIISGINIKDEFLRWPIIDLWMTPFGLSVRKKFIAEV